jgi:signal peptidase II
MISIKKIAWLVFFISVDQLFKYIIRFSGGFYICNKGITWGLTFPKLFIILCFILIILVFILKFPPKADQPWAEKIKNYQKAITFSVLLILSGALSNIIDRLYYGCVIDFIDLKFWPVFNIADIYITVGAILIAWKILFRKKVN